MGSFTATQIESAAVALNAARLSRTPLGRLDPEPSSVGDGYAIQRRGHQLAEEPLGPWKVGATSDEAQRILGVDGPFIGRPFASRVVTTGTNLTIEQWFLADPVIEVEIGLAATRDLTELPDDPLQLADSVAVYPCIELVDARFADMRGVGAASLIADNAVASVIVQGSALDIDPASLDAIVVNLEVDGSSTATGTGSLALGHPLNVLHFAAGLALEACETVRAGELVITGTCTGIVSAAPGMRVRGHVGDGVVEVSFTP